MIKNFSLDNAMYGVVVAIALLTTLSTALTTIAVALGVLFIIYNYFRTKKFPHFDAGLLKILAFYFSTQILIAVTSLDVAVSLREVIGEMHRFLPLLFASTFIKDEKQLRGVLIATLISSFINDAVGVYQYFVKGIPRAIGLEYSPTFFASSMLIQIPILIFMAQENFLPKKLRPVAIGVALLSVLCLGLSMTRGAWLAFIATIFLFAILEKKYRMLTAKLFAALFAAFLIVLAISPQLQARIDTLTDRNFQSNSERILMWESAINIFSDYPVHGIGQKMFEKMYNEHYISPDAKERPDEMMSGHTHPHNNFLFVLSEGGVIGLVSFIGLYVYLFRRFFLQYKQENFMTFSAGLTLLLILAALHLEGLTDTNLNQVKLMREFLVIAGALIAVRLGARG
ncbi:MAG: O-antigen ligase family protein [Selenomonadaceae bacterium]|nr:O-antigen ligase family protein [Selenomonadaceae bacterium]